MIKAPIDAIRPVLAQVFIMFLVWCWMYYTRISAIRRSRCQIQDLADSQKFDKILGNVVDPSDNFENQFELPILFFIAIFSGIVAGCLSPVFLNLAWGFVVLRAVHSVIHCGYNRVMHRFVAYLLSAFCLWGMWACVGLALL